MNDDTEQFEQQLKRQPLRPAPPGWRDGILAAAHGASSVKKSQSVADRSFLSVLNQRLVSMLWPHPVAWGGLAAIWILLFMVNFSLRDHGPMLAEKAVPQSPVVAAQLKQQQRLLAELLGPNDLPDTDRPKLFVPKPRSESTEILSA
jgi:hypothetical protein